MDKSYNGFDPAERYTGQVFYPDRAAQSREMNWMQSEAAHRAKKLADVIFADGDIAEASRCTVNITTGACELEAGTIYIKGAMRDVAAASLTVGVVGQVVVGVFYEERLVSALEDPALYNPAINTASYNEAGADRIKTTITWGIQGDPGVGDFYPVWTIEDGIVRMREPAPQLKATADAIKRYDVDSTGGNYVANGMIATMLPDEDGKQVYSISAGRARVGGAAIEVGVDRRLVYTAIPNTLKINAEPHSSASTALQRVQFDRWPVLLPATVRVQRRKTVTLTHAPIVGAADPLPENSVVKINSVKQGGTTYVQGTDYKLTASQVDWSPPGAEVGPGTQFDVDFEYISTEAVQDQTARDFAITGAVKDAVMYVDYEFAMRRVDVIVTDALGTLDIVKGVPAVWNPVAPSVPAGQLALASILQTWDERRQAVVDQVRTVSMQTLVGYKNRMDDLELDLAELRLSTDLSGRYGGLKKGYFADPMLDNSMRDQGREQTALIAAGALQLYEASDVHQLGDGATGYGIDYTLAIVMAQTANSTTLPITPPALVPPVQQLPASVTLTPAVDRWQSTQQLHYPSPTEIPFLVGLGGSNAFEDQIDASGNHLDASRIDIRGVYMREIEIKFTLAGFKVGELLQQAVFDGVVVAANPIAGGALVGDAKGVIEGRFTVPPKLPVGTKTVVFAGSMGSKSTGTFTGNAEVKVSIPFMQTIGTSVSIGRKGVTYVI